MLRIMIPKPISRTLLRQVELHQLPLRFNRAFSSAVHGQNHDRNSDILVIGAGITGISASIAAAERGASVTLLDASHGGGATALSGGFIYAGGGTPYQKAAGYDDTPENMYAYLKAEIKGAVDDATLQRFCDGSVARLNWLERQGVKFEGSLCPHKSSFPSDRYYLMFTGNEQAWPFRELARPAPRGHRVLAPGFGGGLLSEILFHRAMDLGVKFLPTSKVERVVLDGNGSAVGIEYKSLDPSSKAFRRHRVLTWAGNKMQLPLPGLAAKFLDRAEAIFAKDALRSSVNAPAVILAAGGFAFNEKMRQQYIPEFKDVAPLGTRGDDGSGIRLGQAAGGLIGNMDKMSAWRFIYPPTAFIEGVVVALNGKRFINEDVYGALLSEKMIMEHNGKAFLILDSAQWEKANEQAFEQVRLELLLPALNWLKWDHVRAGSIQELAKKTGVAATGLEETLSAYNDAALAGQLDPLQKDIAYCTPIMKPPFYAIDISPRREGFQMVPGLTLGGLRVDGRSGLVLRENKTTIKGLYAAGRNAVGICSNGYVSGLSLADGVFSGIRAGEHAAEISKA
ncbi:hypothetical protein BDV18DRAFT_140015 [Aspergillus unguis]